MFYFVQSIFFSGQNKKNYSPRGWLEVGSWLEVDFDSRLARVTLQLDNKPIFYKTFFESGITHIADLRFDLDITESYNIITKKMKKAIILVWAGLRHSVPSHFKIQNK